MKHPLHIQLSMIHLSMQHREAHPAGVLNISHCMGTSSLRFPTSPPAEFSHAYVSEPTPLLLQIRQFYLSLSSQNAYLTITLTTKLSDVSMMFWILHSDTASNTAPRRALLLPLIRLHPWGDLPKSRCKLLLSLFYFYYAQVSILC